MEFRTGRFRPYATAGGGLFYSGGDEIASFGSKYNFNYGAGLMVEFAGPIGLRFDARTYSIRGIDDHPLNLLEASTGNKCREEVRVRHQVIEGLKYERMWMLSLAVIAGVVASLAAQVMTQAARWLWDTFLAVLSSGLATLAAWWNS